LSTVRIGRRRSAILPTLVIVAALVVIFAIFTSIWTDRLWYRSFDYGAVFSKMLLTRIGLFAGFGLIMATCVVANAAIAFRLRPRLAGASGSPILERYRDLLESRFVLITVIVGILVGLFAGGSASSRVFDYLAWRNASPFNIEDPKFGIDVSFFVFGYPWWRFTLSFAFAVLSLSVVAAAIVHYTMGGLRFSGPRRGASRAAQAHLSILIGLAVLLRGLGYWFDQYGLAISRTNRLFTGISYTADHATVNAKMILAIIAGAIRLPSRLSDGHADISVMVLRAMDYTSPGTSTKRPMTSGGMIGSTVTRAGSGPSVCSRRGVSGAAAASPSVTTVARPSSSRSDGRSGPVGRGANLAALDTSTRLPADAKRPAKNAAPQASR